MKTESYETNFDCLAAAGVQMVVTVTADEATEFREEIRYMEIGYITPAGEEEATALIDVEAAFEGENDKGDHSHTFYLSTQTTDMSILKGYHKHFNSLVSGTGLYVRLVNYNCSQSYGAVLDVTISSMYHLEEDYDVFYDVQTFEMIQ